MKRRMHMTAERINKEVADLLYVHRRALGLTTDELADRIGCKGGRYRRYERAETQIPLHLLYELRRETGIDLNRLICGDRPEAVRK